MRVTSTSPVAASWAVGREIDGSRVLDRTWRLSCVEGDGGEEPVPADWVVRVACWLVGDDVDTDAPRLTGGWGVIGRSVLPFGVPIGVTSGMRRELASLSLLPAVGGDVEFGLGSPLPVVGRVDLRCSIAMEESVLQTVLARAAAVDRALAALHGEALPEPDWRALCG